MTKALIAALVAAAALTTSAQADDRLAASLGVTPGLYSLGELTKLKDAIDNDDHPRIRFLTRDALPAASTPARSEILHAVGSNKRVGGISSFEIRLRHAEEAGDRQLARHLRAQLGL